LKVINNLSLINFINYVLIDTLRACISHIAIWNTLKIVFLRYIKSCRLSSMSSTLNSLVFYSLSASNFYSLSKILI
jgi:hypothetical protein